MSVSDLKSRDSNNISGNVYRFKLSDSILDKMKYFGKLHQFDDRNDFCEAYDEWFITESEDIDSELRRLQQWGYEGDLKKKMYRSIRYYFNKKKPTTTRETKPEKAQEKRPYRRLPIEIQSRISNKLANAHDEKPSELFESFVQENPDIFENSSDEDKARIKKSFKNIHFNFKPKDCIQTSKLILDKDKDKVSFDVNVNIQENARNDIERVTTSTFNW